jgi:hypothetical protein
MNFFNTFQPTYQLAQPQLDPVKFQQGIQQLDKNALVRLVQQARAQGIPDSQIEAGLNYILNNK